MIGWLLGLLTMVQAAPQTASNSTDAEGMQVFRQAVHDWPDVATLQTRSGDWPTAATAGPCRAWIERVGVSAFQDPLYRLPAGPITQDPKVGDLHYFFVTEHHASGKAIAYGIPAKQIRRAYWLGNRDADLPFEPTANGTSFTLTDKNKPALDPIATVIGIEMQEEWEPIELAVSPGPDGAILLHARDALVHGTVLRYEPEAAKNTLGYWTDAKDAAEWRFQSEGGEYEIELLQGCGAGSGGSVVEVQVTGAAAPALRMTVQDTGHFQNFVPRIVGRLKLEKGEHSLHVSVVEKKGKAAMDLRQVVLKPVRQ